MKIRTILLILLGLVLAGFAASQTLSDLRRVRAAPTDEVLETYAPNTGPLGRPTEMESQPLAATLTPLATPVKVETPVYDGQGNVYLSASEPEPTLARSAEQQPAIPTRIVIPAISLDAPVELAGSQKIRLGSQNFYQWTAPNDYAAGWHTSSAYLGEVGNTVLNGHNNIDGAVFGNLFRLKNGDAIDVYSGERVFHYLVAQVVILEEADQPPAKRLENARWISHSDDVRLTLVTCWPNDGNTHRLYVVAVPAG